MLFRCHPILQHPTNISDHPYLLGVGVGVLHVCLNTDGQTFHCCYRLVAFSFGRLYNSLIIYMPNVNNCY